MRVDVLGIDVTVVDVLKIHIDVTALSSSDCFEKKMLAATFTVHVRED